MILPMYIFIGSTITLVILAGVFRVEDRRERYLFLGVIRGRFDQWVAEQYLVHHRWSGHLGRGFFRLLFHYFIHGILDRLLRFVRWMEARVERLMRHNRQVAKTIGAEKRETHLTAIAAHKAETALTERQKQKLKVFK